MPPNEYQSCWKAHSMNSMKMMCLRCLEWEWEQWEWVHCDPATRRWIDLRSTPNTCCFAISISMWNQDWPTVIECFLCNFETPNFDLVT